MNKINKLKELVNDLEIALEVEAISSDIKDEHIKNLNKKVDRLSSDAARSMVMYQDEKRKAEALERELLLATNLIHNLQLKILAVTGEKIEY